MSDKMQDQANNPGEKQKQSPDQANNPDWNKDGGSDQAGQQKEVPGQPRKPGADSDDSDIE